MALNFAGEMKAFGNWLKANSLHPLAQLMWFKLMLRNNDCMWSEWFVASNQDLMSMIGVGSEKTAISMRDKLIDSGLIEYHRGKKGSPGKYHINQIYCSSYRVFDSTSDSVFDSNNAVYLTVQPTATIKQDKTNIYDDVDDARAGAEEITPSWLFAYYFGREATQAEVQQCALWLDLNDADLVEHAFQQACSVDAKNLAYVRGVLRNFRRREIKDMGDVAEDDMRRAAGR